ncbi:MAG: hypothetical protein ACI93R_001409 [Flavobacteriales bacterium]|jgi:hypothetical protein
MLATTSSELIDTLAQLIDILDRDGKTHWSQWMRVAKKRIEESDLYGVDKVLAAYGGIGTFNETYLSKSSKEKENFSRLQGKVWMLARDIQSSLEPAE